MAVLASFLFAIMKYSSKDNFKKVYFTSQFMVQSTRVRPSRQRTLTVPHTQSRMHYGRGYRRGWKGRMEGINGVIIFYLKEIFFKMTQKG